MEVTKRIECFQDTLNCCAGAELVELTREAAAASRVYQENFASQRLYKVRETEIQVVENTTFQAARENLSGGKVAVLNFANPHYPGGGVTRGAMAQEECLCRSSNLYPCLADEGVFDDFYGYHRSATDYDFSDRLIYTPGVTVFKDDSPIPELMDRENWFRVDVITCAAPFQAKRRHVNSRVLEELMKKRIRNILEAAIENEIDVLILGAFGCGAFRNPPHVVAKAFRMILAEERYRTAFSRVIFAIKPSSDQGPCPNMAAFILQPWGSREEVKAPADDLDMFRLWKQENAYAGKQFSILGDSISTLEGFNPRNYQVYYRSDNREKTGIWNPEDAWWGKVIAFFGGELLVNDAWSGSRVSRMLGAKDRFPSGCSDRRIGNLHQGGVMPDVIMVYMGINDWGNGVPVTQEGDVGGDNGDTCFSMAYSLMLRQLREKYPKAEILCCTLCETCISTNPSFRFPEAHGGISLREYNKQIVNVARAWGCRVLDLNAQGIPLDTLDGIHPNAEGMDTLAMLMVRQMADDFGAHLLDCPGEHEVVNGVCRRCGKRIMEKRSQDLKLRLRDSGKMLILSGWQITLGRGKDCALVVENPYVARSQATFTCRDGLWHIRDNNTRNGTYLNGTRLEQNREYLLSPGDVVSFAKKVEAEVLD